ncbi:MAG: protein phosphatase 1 regulatory subunit 42 [Crocinitomicaceae bacterium]|nr:protein phosphatase 1 regulatory subunit 42 [Crocinitomicaceae bacterium]
MKNILVIILITTCNVVFSQVEKVNYYTIDQLKNVSIDSVFAINLSKKKLKKLPEILFKFKHIQYLDLSKNQLADIDGIETFTELQYLNVEKNKLEYFPKGICQLVELTTLILNRNVYIDQVPSCIVNCQKLKFIDLWYTSIESLPQEMTEIKTLEKIDLSGVQIDQDSQTSLKKMFPKVRLIMSPPCNCMK